MAQPDSQPWDTSFSTQVSLIDIHAVDEEGNHLDATPGSGQRNDSAETILVPARQYHYKELKILGLLVLIAREKKIMIIKISIPIWPPMGRIS